MWRVINTIALLGLLIYFVKKPLVNFFQERKNSIARELDEAREKRDEAVRLIEEYKTKMAGMEQELAKMSGELKKAAESDSQKLVATAEKLSAAMIESARVTAEQEVRKARILLKNEAVELAMTMAEALIKQKINDQDRKRIVEDYLVKVGGMK
jgi:F-type H+-transporting ATPase subunit b